MALTPQEIEDAPKITIGGKQWPIPLLAARQNKVIDPLIMSLIPLMASLCSKDPGQKLWAMGKIGQEEYNKFFDIAYHALLRAHPEMTREVFEDMPVQFTECVNAFDVIAAQTGLFKKAEKKEGESGEAQAASLQTGTTS